MKSKEESPERRPFLGVKFDCCGVYTRVYRKPEEKEYAARCPKCMRALVIRVDEKEGVPAQFVRAW